ncbi:MAG: nucleotide-diphospho-sugar transferase [Promethearchaeota archaeon]
MHQFNTPILFIIFNRPETTEIVFEKIASIKPKKLYIAADGPRQNIPDDKEKCFKTRKIIERIDWDCHIKTKFNEINLGCGLNVSSAISWVLEQEERVIILEDDTVPALPFFYFCDELLEKYKDDTRIMHIAGSNLNEDFKWGNDSYFFSMYTPIWGWATWKRAWAEFDYYMSDLDEFIYSNSYKNIFLNRKEQRWFVNRWNSFKRKNYLPGVSTNWDYQWEYAVFKNNGLSIIPASNLISNIGYFSSHSDGEKSKIYNRKVDNSFKIKKHPKFIIRNRFYDSINSKRYNREKSIIFRLINKIKKISTYV